MADRTLTINHADGGSETYTINRDKFAGVREMQVDGAAVTVDHTAVPKHQSKETTLGGSQSITVKRDIEPLLSKVVGGAAAAYSLRDLNDKANTSKVVRVRRESDNNERDFTAKDVSNGTLQNWTNAQVTPPLDLRELTATGRDGPIIEAAAAYSLRNLSDSYAGDVVEVRRNTDGALKDFKASEVTDGTLEAWVNTSFANALPLDTAGAAAAAYSLRNLSSSYTGSVVEVRRSSDGTVRSFTAAEVTDGTLVAWVNEVVVLYVQQSSTSGWWHGSNLVVTNNGDYLQFTGNGGRTTAGNMLGTPAVRKTDGSYSITFEAKHISGGTFVLGEEYGGPDILQVSPAANGGEWTSYTAAVNPWDGGSSFASLTKRVIFTSDNGAVWQLKSVVISQVSGANGTVSKWYDQSGNDNHATQGTPASQPKIVDAGALVVGGLSFDGTNDTLDISVIAASQPITTFTTYKATASNSVPFGTDVTATISAGRRFNDEYVLFAGTVISSGVHPSTEVLSSALFSGASSEAWWNGASILSGNTGTNGGIDSIGASGVSRMTGTIQEIIIYNTDQTDKRRAIEENIGSTYGITLTSSKDGTVSKWYDQSTTSGVPNANHAVQTDAAKQPKIVDAGVLVSGGIDFDGASHFETIESGVLTNIQDTFTAFIGMRRNSSTGNFSVASTFPNRLYINPNSVIVGEPYDLAPINFPNDVLTLGVAQGAAGNYTAFKNGAETGTAYTDETGAGSFTLGSNNTYTANLDGKIAEFIIYDSDQSDNRTALEANIGEVYGIAGIPAYDNTVNGFVETWYDQSGNGNNLSQSVSTRQPLIVDEGTLVTNPEGSPSIWGKSSGRWLDSATNQVVTSDLSVYAVWTTPSNLSTLLGFSTNQNIIRIGDNAWRMTVQNVHAPYLSFSSLPVGETALVNINRHSNIIGANFNSTLSSETATLSGTFIWNRIFNRSGTGASYNDYTGKASELIIYNSDQSANRPAIEANINNQYDIY